MAKVKMDPIVAHLSSQIRRALEDAVKETIPDVEFDAHDLYRNFKRAVRRKCNTWETVSDSYVDAD